MFTKITVQNTIYFCGVYFIFHNLMKYKHIDHEENLLNDLKHSNLFNKIFKSLLNYTINVHVSTVLKQMPSKCYSLKLLMTMNQGDISKKTFKSGGRKNRLQTLSSIYSCLNRSSLPCIFCILPNTVQVLAHGVPFSHQAALVCTMLPAFINDMK